MIPIAIPVLEEEEADAARQVVLSGWVSQGPQVAAFEKEFAALVGAPYACAVSSCTAALHLALLALDVGPDDEVIKCMMPLTTSYDILEEGLDILECSIAEEFMHTGRSFVAARIAAARAAQIESLRAPLKQAV